MITEATQTESASDRNTTDLLHRNSDGMDITLLWNHDTESLTIRMVDRWHHRVIEFDMPTDRATYALHHPFAWAYETPLRAEQLTAWQSTRRGDDLPNTSLRSSAGKSNMHNRY